MDIGDYRLVVAGSGFFGATIAERAAHELGLPVLVIERREHVGGNSHSEADPATGIELHRYGTHIFHTSSEEIWRYANRFADFNNFRLRVFSRVAGRTYSLPINLTTINRFFGMDMTPAEAERFIAAEVEKEGILSPGNLEEAAIARVGRSLYEAFIKGYTAKQWETDPALLPVETIRRLPIRFSMNDFYFSDRYEGVPLEGYGALFSRLLASPRIRVITGCDFFDLRESLNPGALIVFSGAIDRFFDYRLGALGWRTLDHEIERLPVEDYQGTAVINFPGQETPFTRIHEFKHLHPERRRSDSTVIMREYSRFARRGDEPFYPIGRREDKRLYEDYRALAQGRPNVIFGGRLGSYRYLDMHQAIGSALRCFETVVAPRLVAG
jgi:UDP-galactopyranose mutase